MLVFEKRTPFNTTKAKFKILIGCLNFSNLTGMPMYLYRLGKEFVSRGIDITIVSKKIGGHILNLATKAGIRCFQIDEDEYKKEKFDVLLLNETESEVLLDHFPSTPAWNYIHSASEIDRPITYRPQIRGYFCPRKQVKDFWEERYDYDVEVIPIPVDFQKFRKYKNKKHNTYNILAPCTQDTLRKPMLLSLIKLAREDRKIRLRIVGRDHGALNNINLPFNVEVLAQTSKIVDHFKWADEVAGIFIGTVTLEAWAMGKKTSIYDEKGRHTIIKPYKDFKKLHNVKNIADLFLQKFNEKWADIIIPHHDQADLLAQTLKTIPIRNYNVIISRGGTFSENCNKGSRVAKTEKLIFANDDLVINPQVLWQMIDCEEDIVGVQQYFPDGETLCLGVTFNENWHYVLTNNIKDVLYPSGAFFAIKKKLFRKLRGFSEKYINGAEDQDLFLRALENGCSIAFVKESVIHYCSQSEGRFDHIQEDDRIFFKKWSKKKLKLLFSKYK